MHTTDDNRDKNGSFEHTLRSERDKLQREIESLRNEIAEREIAYRAKEKRLGHIVALLDAEPESPSTQSRSVSAPAGRSTPTAQLLDMAEQVLRERKRKPMHYRDLADELILRGAVIRGKDPANSLVSRMTTDDKRRPEGEKRFIRPTSKGFYALREFYPNARNVGSRRNRRPIGINERSK